MRARFEKMIRAAQDEICGAIEELDGQKFQEDAWTRPGGGGGISRVLQGGDVFEKAGVNVSVVYGQMPPEAYRAATGEQGAGKEMIPFFAAGISSVMHPHNPMAPTVHFNYRYFETDAPEGAEGSPRAWWFGGGTDLTPSYIFDDDAAHFHGTLKDVCDKHDEAFYPKFKKWADEYFIDQAPHGETRGLGGIFFDDQNDRDPGGDLRLRHGHGRRGRAGVRAARREAQGRRVHGGAEGVAADAPRALRGVQPRVRPRDHLRVADGRAHRIHPHVPAPHREVAVRHAARRGEPRSGRHRRLPQPPHLGRVRQRMRRSARSRETFVNTKRNHAFFHSFSRSDCSRISSA